ncbi:MFS transporter [Nocardioides sp.]|uniref:MFS transporter n=1 Tax=Nocardioides sp. TaxID=35761 RepID=UPI00286E596C|nr:MFS transporter [Nocardioides sp.]
MVTDDSGNTSHALPVPVRALIVARAVNRIGAFALPFTAVILVEDFHASVTTAGAVVALFGLASIPSRLVGGVLADRWGRRPTMLLGLIGCAMAQLAFAASPTLLLAAVAVALLGLVFELYEPPSQAIIADLCPPEQRPRAYSLLGTALAVAGVAAGLVATVLGSVDLRWLLVADAASCLAAAALVLAAVPSLRPSADTSAGPGSPWRDRRLLVMWLAGIGFATLYLGSIVALPLTLLARGLPASHLGWLLSVSAAVMVIGQRLLRDWAPTPFRAMTIGYVALAAGLAVAGLATSMAGFVLAVAIWSVGDLLLLGHPFAVVAGLAPAGASARYLAAFGTCWGVAAVIAPLGGTRLLAIDPSLPWVCAAALSLVLAAVQPLIGRAVGSGAGDRVGDGGLTRHEVPLGADAGA